MLWESLLPPSEMGNPSREIVSARDYILRYADGNSAICLTSGLWNVNFGYNNPYVAKRITEVLHSGHYATLFRHSNQIAKEAAERLLEKVGWKDGAVVYSTSGSALNDVAVKLAYHWNALTGRRIAKLIVSVTGSYHGMTLNSMFISGDALNQQIYSMGSHRYIHLPYNDAAAWEKFFDDQGKAVALVLLEPVLGTGAIPLSEEVLKVIFDARKKFGFLVAADEVAMGYYRLGVFASSFLWSELPDLIGFSKALTNGTAASSALLVSPWIARDFIKADTIFMHGETQAGSPVAAAAILGVFDYLDTVDIVQMYATLYKRVDSDLDIFSKKYGWSRGGVGLFQFLGMPSELFAGEFANIMPQDYFRAHGISVQPAPRGIQLIPAITMPISLWAEAFERLSNATEQLLAMR